MRYFACALGQDGEGVPEALRSSLEALPLSRGIEYSWQEFGAYGRPELVVLEAWNDNWGDPFVVDAGSYVAVGNARLDNRRELERSIGIPCHPESDLALMGRVIARLGPRSIAGMLGDFAILFWDGATREVVVATDAFAVHKLFHRQHGRNLIFASRAEALASGERYDTQHLAELVGMCVLSPGLTVYEGVRQLAPGSWAIGRSGTLNHTEYWSPEKAQQSEGSILDEAEATAQCRGLMAESVMKRLGPSGTTWAQLSGGLDSSSIVGVAEWLAERGDIGDGLAGTITYVDRQGTAADERRYSDAVAERWRVRNELVVDPPLWLDGDTVPPRTDQPRHSLAFFPRERRMAAAVRRGGGRILLSGFGGDELFTGTMMFFADWIANGSFRATCHELLRRATIGRTSFWELAYTEVLLPLFPDFVRHRLLGSGQRIPGWVTPELIKRHGLSGRGAVARTHAGMVGGKYRHAMVRYLTDISLHLDPGLIGESLDIRYPFLSRPLAEFALRLPPSMCVQPQARKWVLRQAMKDILPEEVRLRIGKGDSVERVAWSMTAQRKMLGSLVDRPILADLGVVDPTKLRAAFDSLPRCHSSQSHLHSVVQSTLLIEAWLQVRSDRWPPKSCLRAAAV